MQTRSSDSQLRLDDIVQEAIRLARSGELDTLLNKHGAVYFKDLGLKDAGEFSEFAHAFGWVPHEDIGNPVRRTIHARNVASANEGPNTQPVYPHNEFGLSPHYPSYVLFYCVTAPETGTYDLVEGKSVITELCTRRRDAYQQFSPALRSSQRKVSAVH